MSTDDLIKHIRKVVREEVEAEAKITRRENSLNWVSLSGKMDRVEDRLKNVEIGTSRLETAGEALKAGLDDIRDTMATKADIHDLRVEVVSKIKDHANRIEELEKEVGLPHPHKH